MDVASMFSDDQLAVLGCFFALAVCGLIAAISFRLGPAGQLKQSQRISVPLISARSAEAAKSKDRRAA